MYQLVALDVDGTLLNSQHRLTSEAQDAIQQAKEHGAHVCLATGKLLISVHYLINALQLAGPQITCNGAALMNSESGEVITSWPIDSTTCQASLTAIREIAPDQAIAWYTANAIYTDSPPGDLDTILAAYHEPPLHHVARLDDQIPPALKLLMTGDPSHLARLRDELTTRLGNRATVMRTTADFVEIVSPHVSKGAALSALAQRLGIARANIVAIGDGENDLSLFEVAGVSIAMANAMPELKRHADAITASADEHGVAHALTGLGLARIGDASRLQWQHR
jgi:Cof subfamily protein (haloacid dehalogenase superfamily)